MRRVYIGRISHHVRERDIERFFKSEGRIRDILMKDGFAFVEFEHLGDAESAVRHLNGRDLNGERVHVEFAKGPPRGRNGVIGGRGDSTSGGNGGMGFGRRDGPMRRDGPGGGSSSGRRDFRNDRGRDRGDTHGGRTGGGGGGGGGISYAEKYGPPRNTDFRIIVENLSSRVSWQDLKDLMRQAGEVTFADAHKRERNVGIVDFASLKDLRNAIEKFNETDFMGRRIKVYEDKSRRRSNGGRRSGRSRSRSRGYSNSRSRSRDRPAASRSRSRSPITRHDSPSRPRSVSSSPNRRETQRSRSRSRGRSKDSSLSGKRQSRSRSRSPVAREERGAPSRSRSASGSPAAASAARRDAARSRSRSRSRASSRSEKNQSRSRSGSPNGRERSRSRSASGSSRGSPAGSRSNEET